MTTRVRYRYRIRSRSRRRYLPTVEVLAPGTSVTVVRKRGLTVPHAMDRAMDWARRNGGV